MERISAGGSSAKDLRPEINPQFLLAQSIIDFQLFNLFIQGISINPQEASRASLGVAKSL